MGRDLAIKGASVVRLWESEVQALQCHRLLFPDTSATGRRHSMFEKDDLSC